MDYGDDVTSQGDLADAWSGKYMNSVYKGECCVTREGDYWHQWSTTRTL